jgi:sorbitol/mannitol transport system permease protein
MRSSTPPRAATTASKAGAETPGRWRMLLQTPSVVALALWMTVPLALTVYFSFLRYSLLNPEARGFAGLENYRFLWEDPAFFPVIRNTLALIGSVLVITVGLGTLLAVLYERRFFGRNAAALLLIAPFFVMPTVSALVWKNMILHPVYGLLARAFGKAGLAPIDWFGRYPMLALILIISWEWLPFAFLILYTSLKSLDAEQKEAAQIDGANAAQFFFHITIPHLRRAMSVVVMIETIFLLSIFAEIYTTTSGGPGTATTNLAYLVYSLGLQQFDVGIASAGGILAVVLANIAAWFLVRLLARSLKGGP